MATYKVRGIAHNIIYPYRTEDGKVKHQWETYSTELEAMHRKAYIDYLQKNRLHHEIRKAVARGEVAAHPREKGALFAQLL